MMTEQTLLRLEAEYRELLVPSPDEVGAMLAEIRRCWAALLKIREDCRLGAVGSREYLAHVTASVALEERGSDEP